MLSMEKKTSALPRKILCSSWYCTDKWLFVQKLQNKIKTSPFIYLWFRLYWVFMSFILVILYSVRNYLKICFHMRTQIAAKYWNCTFFPPKYFYWFSSMVWVNLFLCPLNSPYSVAHLFSMLLSWHLMDQRVNLLIEKIFSRLIDSENNQKLQPRTLKFENCIHLFSTTLLQGTALLSVLTFVSWCIILHPHSFLAACQVSHFEPAGIDGIFITSNPFVMMMMESHSRYEKCIATSVGKSLISSPSLSSDLVCPFSLRYPFCAPSKRSTCFHDRKFLMRPSYKIISLGFLVVWLGYLTFGDVAGLQSLIKTIIHPALFPTWYFVLKSSRQPTECNWIHKRRNEASRLLNMYICQ